MASTRTPRRAGKAPQKRAPASAARPLRAAYATDPATSQGRARPEPACPMRTPFQRDRDRIVHASAFRRLTHKTQVFVYHEGDHYRTRLTHSLEVAQIARAIARMLALDEDLAEALALAHDLGHPPFGHAGERALHAAMAGFGGFDHNAQSFKVVTQLERKYAAFDGLNLSFETLEGLVKHNGPLLGPGAGADHGVMLRLIGAAGLTDRLYLDLYGPAEAQVAALADDIAYNNHDIDDGVRAGLITLDDLAVAPLAGRFVAAARATGAETRRLVYEITRRMITLMVADVVVETRRRVEARNIASLDDVRDAGVPLIAFSDELAGELAGLKAFLFERVYRHPRVMGVMGRAETVVADLFARYWAIPGDLPSGLDPILQTLPPGQRAERICDFVAGMTDRYALEEHRRLFDATPDLR